MAVSRSAAAGVTGIDGVLAAGVGGDAASTGGGDVTWHSGIDGGAWDFCPTCRVSAPATERGECATCGTFIVADRCERCRRRLERDPVMGTHYAPCEDCHGGEGLTFDEALAGSLSMVNAQHEAAKVK